MTFVMRDKILAEREGFEPSIELPLYTLSRRAPSTTRTPLQNWCSAGKSNHFPMKMTFLVVNLLIISATTAKTARHLLIL